METTPPGGKGWGTHILDGLMENGNERMGHPPVRHPSLKPTLVDRLLLCMTATILENNAWGGPLSTSGDPNANAVYIMGDQIRRDESPSTQGVGAGAAAAQAFAIGTAWLNCTAHP